ncbi:MAG: deoxyribodipyrimidine photo-lyase [Halolamina sp.]
MQLFWHRQDLRVADNVGLAAAAAEGPVVPAFVFDRAVLDRAGAPRVRYMLDALAELRAAYRDRGSDLVVARGDPREVLPELATAHDADRVVWNVEYSGLARERDDDVGTALSKVGVDHESFHDDVHHEPGTITTNAGDPYSVFTYFGRKWHDREKEDPYDAPTEAQLLAADDVAVDAVDLPTIEELGFSEPAADVQDAGTAPARERLAAFCDGPVERYEDRRDFPADDNTSRLSADLSFGTIGVREVYEETEAAKLAATDEAAVDSITEFQEQLAWREFYTQVLYHNPEVVTENYKEYENEIQWRDDETELAAWKAGETGYPIVDAGMRQLKREAFMHNRVRMIVASFLTKDLLVDWRAGYHHFREHLADHDTANNNGGWQWAASTGTDAQPYFRIFNPMKQGADYDPDAEYISEYVPELDGVPPEKVHSWHELGYNERERLAPAYPHPIVDHSERREEALAMFERARGEADD